MSIIFFGLLGLVIGSIFAKESAAMLTGVLLSTAMLLFSDVFLPLEAFPLAIKTLFMYNPFMVSVFALKRVILFHVPLSFVSRELIVLGIYSILAIGMLWVANKTWAKQQYKKSFKRKRKPYSK